MKRPSAVVDHDALTRDYPPPPEYFDTAWLAEPAEIERRQLERLQARAAAAARVPFFAKRWADGGFDPTQLRSVADLSRAPSYTVHDIRKSIEAHPPFGDYQGALPDGALDEPVRVYMSGGTTGESRPTFYTQWDRDVGALLTARALYMQGIRPGDVVMNSWLYGTHNGAWIFDEALYQWLNCVVLTASAGTVTSSERQVQLAVDYGVKAILTTGDYLLRLAEVARGMGFDPATDLQLTALPNIGDRERLEAAFGVECFESYGFHEVQWVSVECPAHDGLHIFEDAFVVEIVDPETGELLPDGELGSICITELYKTGSPQFRYNMMDLSCLYPRERCACGSWLRRMAPFAGRADNMVKLRGVNVWPEAVAELAMSVEHVEPDWFLRAVRSNDRDEMIFSVVSTVDPTARPTVQSAVETRLKDALGVRIGVEVVAPGALDEWTGAGTMPKLRRFRDDRTEPQGTPTPQHSRARRGE
jgi:phenylacetate-CoA ligase